MVGDGVPEQSDVYDPCLNPSIPAKAVPVVVPLFDAVFDGPYFQCEVGPHAVVALNQLVHGLVVVVCGQRHQGKHGMVVVAKPLHSAWVTLSASAQRHQFGKALVDQPLAGFRLVVHGMDKEAKLRVSVSQQPIAEFPVA